MNSIVLKAWVVDDDPMYQEMLLSYLKILGHNAQGFFTGEELLQNLSSQPDVVILDHNLGTGLTGVDVLRKIKETKSNIPVIYISSEEKVSLVSDAYRNGSDDYIGKDSASLLRLKLRLEKIELMKAVSNKKIRRKRTLTLLIGFLLAFILGIIVFKLFIF